MDNNEASTYQFLPWRGVSDQTFRFYGASTKMDNTGKPISIGFRYPNGDYKVRSLDKKDFFWIKSSQEPTGLFGQDKFAAGSHKYVIITEGEIDACSLYQATKTPVVSVSSSTSAARDCAMARSYLASFERIYLAFDSDAAGRDATKAVARLFDYDRLWEVRFSNRKDANEYTRHGEESELRNIFYNSKRYLPDTLISSREDFIRILSEEPQQGVPYPWKKLTEMTYGIRTGESVLITAQEGVGKTELMHAIEYGLLRNTSENIGAIFLEEPEKRHLEAITGIHLKRPIHLPDSGCTKAEKISALGEVVPEDDRLYIHTHFGSDDPESFLDTIRFLVSARNCRYILLDHITMAVSGLDEDNERRKLDYFSTKLQMMVKELDFAFIVVSHVNDFGQTRGSRYVSKVANIRIDAVRDVSAADPILRNTTFLTVSKNRWAGKTGPAGSLFFNHDTFCFEESADDGHPDGTDKGSSILTSANEEGRRVDSF